MFTRPYENVLQRCKTDCETSPQDTESLENLAFLPIHRFIYVHTVELVRPESEAIIGSCKSSNQRIPNGKFSFISFYWGKLISPFPSKFRLKKLKN